jgi:hypothetical protein
MRIAMSYPQNRKGVREALGLTGSLRIVSHKNSDRLTENAFPRKKIFMLF